MNTQAVQWTEVKHAEMDLWEIKSNYNNGIQQNKTEQNLDEHKTQTFEGCVWLAGHFLGYLLSL